MLRAAIGPRPTHFSCDIFDRVLGTLMYFSTNVLRATRGARNPKLQVVITHASHVCSHHSFGLQLRNEWNAQNAIWSRAFGPSITRYLSTRVLTICHVKPMQSTAMQQKRFDIRSLSPTLRNLWLLLVSITCFCVLEIFHKSMYYFFMFSCF